MKKVVEQPSTPDWYNLLEEAVKEPGELASAHRYFHKYSLVNRWLASTQLRKLGLPLLPINTFGTKDKETGKGKTGWLGFGRHVKANEKATVSLIMPVPVKKKKETDDGETDVVFTKFLLRRAWFHLEQTDGEEYVVEEHSATPWLMESAFDFLGVTEAPFEFNGVTDTRLGYVQGRAIAVSPLETYPTFGRIRQMAHVVLGHTDKELGKGVPLDEDLQAIEAETAAYLCAATLGFSGMEQSRQRLQERLSGATRIPDRCAQRAFSAADKMLNAGYC